jgi:hypothetical protein
MQLIENVVNVNLTLASQGVEARATNALIGGLG